MPIRFVAFKKSLLAFLALLIIAFAPLLQQLHLATCHCELCQCAKHNVNLAEYNRKIGFCFKNFAHSGPVKVPVRHDRDNCPICQMYASICSGFNIPHICADILAELVLLDEVEHRSSVIESGAFSEYPSRAPPSC